MQKGTPCAADIAELEANWNTSFKAAPHKYFESMDHRHNVLMLHASPFTTVHICMATAAVA